MFGTNEVFEYFKCAECGCLQITAVPDDLKRHYGSGYYSFKEPENCFDNTAKAGFKHLRADCALGGRSLLARMFLRLYPPPAYFDWLKEARVTLDSEILDVGCGAGELLVRLKKDGFKSLTGLDAFIENDVCYENGVRIYRQILTEHRARYDFIMLHHSFEHMPDPLKAARGLHRNLRADRTVLIRIPVVSSHAWKKYGLNWVQLDAPRHLYLHTEKSMRILAQKTGFEVKKIVYDSDEFQFWGSEQYMRGISLRAPESLANGLGNSMFTKKQLINFKRKAADLNKTGAGDQACFYLYKP
ncbi:MAG: class I SAM-dependent methyltransferase [Desulfobacterales bacterium]|nr:class I SAM-dependent methyltransferase [Desulfobacterales bacterium]